MSDQNGYGGYIKDSDLCPNCGAVKVFSALVCPSCGVNYDEAARKKAQNTAAGQGKSNAFDPNAAFAKFKNSLEDNTQASSAGEFGANTTEAGGVPVKDSSMGGIGVNGNAATENGISEITPLSDIAELDKPDAQDPIAKKLSELNGRNSGMYGERKYRLNTPGTEEVAEASNSDAARSYTVQDGNVVDHGAARYGSSYSGGAWQSGTGTQNGGAWQSGVNNQNMNAGAMGAGSMYGGSTRQYSNSVSNRYNDYRNDSELSGTADRYASPYSRGSFDVVPEKKPSTFKKMLPFLVVLILIGAGVAAYFYITGLNKNEKGVEYTKGSLVGKGYENEWAEIRVNFTDDVNYYSTMDSMMDAYLPEEKREAVDVPLYFTTRAGNGLMLMTCKTGIFGMDEEEFLSDDEMNLTVAMYPTFTSYKNEPDMLLGSHVYKCVSVLVEEDGIQLNCYICVRSIGNRVVCIMIYDQPNKSQLGIIKSMFKKW